MLVQSYYDASGYPVTTGQPKTQQAVQTVPSRRSLEGDRSGLGDKTHSMLTHGLSGREKWRQRGKLSEAEALKGVCTYCCKNAVQNTVGNSFWI
ncbi:MAG: hypothetical protein F7B59_01065 [Desulfurococcales archaeon]|nr:hypothetical protein [Desulfurococcales archaeon]